MYFVVIASPRTGSTHLTRLLDSQAGVVCHNELFHPKEIFLRWPKQDRTIDVMRELEELRARDASAFVERIFERGRSCAHCGFKIFSGHNDQFLDKMIADSAFRKIVLWRQNLLASYSSTLLKKKAARRAAKAQEKGQLTVTFEPARFIAFSRTQTAFYQSVFDKLNHARQVFCAIEYGQINDPWFLASLVNFIGAGPGLAPQARAGTKLNSSAIVSRFSNPDCVNDFLRQHDLLGWSHELLGGLDPLANSITALDRE